MHVDLTLTPRAKTKALPVVYEVYKQNCLYLSLSPCVECLLRMKDDAAELDGFNFSQGTSDQESNGSGSYYIKQEP